MPVGGVKRGAARESEKAPWSARLVIYGADRRRLHMGQHSDDIKERSCARVPSPPTLMLLVALAPNKSMLHTLHSLVHIH